MLLNYARTALRGMQAHPAAALINIVGLAIGLCCFLCSLLYIRYELGYDSGFAQADRIYRISLDGTLPSGRRADLASTAWPVAELLLREFPQVVAATRFDDRRVLLASDALAFYQDGFRVVDANFFTVFDLPWLAGDPATALTSPDAIVLTQSLATRYFGEADPLGQSMLVDNQHPLVVRGVIADLPVNTHLTGEAFASTALLRLMFDDPANFLENWNYVGLHTYFVLAPGADIAQVEQRLAAFEAKYMPAIGAVVHRLRITPLKDIYRMPALRGTLKTPLDTGLLYLLGCVAFAILLIACVNFVNLTLARAFARIRETAVRKAAGASRRQLVLQFVCEAVLLTALAMLLALLLMELLLPTIGQFSMRPLELSFGADVNVLVLIVLAVGTSAGLYPAWKLASFNTVQATRGLAAPGGIKRGLLGNVLLVFQFSVAIVLLVASAVVLLQLRHMRSVDMGFSREGVVTLQASPAAGLGSRLDTLKRELLQHPQVTAVTASNHTPFQGDLAAVGTRASTQPEPVEMARLDVSYDFFATYGIELLAGRAYSPAFPADMAVLEEKLGSETSANFVVNASGAAAFGWTAEEAIGKAFEVFIEDSYIRRGTIVGVVADSRFEQADAAVRPTVFVLVPSQLHWSYPSLTAVSVKVRGADPGAALQHIDATWTRVYPEMPLLRGFVSDDFERVYVSETKLRDALGLLAFLALFIACLGLHSLASYNAQRRVKEIGVRKVMGGSVWSIVLLLTNEFSKLVLVSNIIAWPLAYMAMERWLENFAYRIDLTPLVFIGSGAIALCIAWVTVASKAASVASRNPVHALRYE